MKHPSFPEKRTTYGGPDDPFVRLEERFRLDGDILYVDISIIPRAYAKTIQLDFVYTRPPLWKRVWRRFLAWCRR